MVLRQPEQAVEIVQDTYLQVWQQADRYSPARGTVLTWLAMIAHHRAVDRIGPDRQPRPAKPVGRGLATPSTTTPSTGSRYESTFRLGGRS